MWLSQPIHTLPERLAQLVWGWALAWWRILYLGAVVCVLVLSPSSYGKVTRRALARHLYLDTAPVLLGFTVLAALISLVLTRIVVVTAISYGLSRYALEMVIRVLVLELIPLIAALFVAVEYTIPGGSELYKLRRAGALQLMRASGREPLSHEVLPRVLAGMFAVLLLALLSALISLVLAYVAVHGFTLAGLPSYNHAVGNIFNPVVSMIFCMKTLLFALAVALLPVANALRDIPRRGSRTSVELQGLVQMSVLMLVIEIASLIGNYY